MKCAEVTYNKTGFQIVEMCECEWWSPYKTDGSVERHLRENFPYKRPLSEDHLLQGIIDGQLFVTFNVILKFPNIWEVISQTSPIFKNTVVSREDIGNMMREDAEKENIMTQPRRMLTSSFVLSNGTIITPLLLFYLKLGLVCKKIHRFVQDGPRKCFNNFIQSGVDARRQGEKNPNSSVVAETTKLLSNSSYGYEIMVRSRHTVTKYLSDEKSHSAINSKLFKRLNHIPDQLYEVELVKPEIEHREPIIVGFFILQYAKQRMLELYCNFFKKFCDTDKYEELEMDTDSLYLALSEENLEDVILPEKRAEWEQLRSKIALISLLRMQPTVFSPERVVMPTWNVIRESQASSKKNLEMLCLCSKTYCCNDKHTNKYKCSNKGLNERTLEKCGDRGPMSKYRKVLEESVNVTSTNREFLTIQHSVAT